MSIVKKRFEKNYASAGGAKAIGPIIAILLPILIEFVTSLCPAKDIKEVTRDSEPFVRRKLINAAIKEGHSRPEARRIAQAGIDTINQSSAADLESA